MKRYIVRAVFDDPDFGDIDSQGFYWTAKGARKVWRELETIRVNIKENKWHYEVLDTKTNEVIAP